MATYQLRPMSLGEILDGALTLLRRHFGLLFAMSVVCLGLPTVLEFSSAMTPQTDEGTSLLVNLGLTLLRYLGYLVLTGATVRAVSEAYLGRTPRFGESLGFAMRRLGGIFISGLAAGVLTFLATLALVIPGVVVACGYAVTVQTVVLESLPSSVDALGRSWSLTKGFKGKAFLLYLVMFVLFFVVFFGAGVLVGFAGAMVKALFYPGVLFLGALFLLFYPFASCVFTLFYYDLRVRKEALDLEFLSQQIGAVSAPV